MAPRNVRCEYTGCPRDARYFLWGKLSTCAALCFEHAGVYHRCLLEVELWTAGMEVLVGVN